MAPILKELDAPAATTSASTPAAPHSKPTSDAPVRPQPVALEIPVTVNGARTVDGSDKRVPFSESTQTVLVFPHGAVIRIATPLTSGQLVFLTNEKTKKEVVCQVVKSKSTGTAGAYVELQFTEASAGFWGLQIPGASAAPAALRPAAPAQPALPKAPTPVATKPPTTPKPAPPAAISPLPAKPTAPPIVHPVPVAQPSASATSSVPVVPPSSPVAAVPHSVAEPEPVKSTTPAHSEPQISLISGPPAASVIPSSPVAPEPVIPVPPLHDYAKEISALFAVPQAPAAPAAPEHQPASAPPEPSTEELKLQAARLQTQLSSLLFTETPAASPASPAAPPVAKPETDIAEVAKKILEIPQEAPKLVGHLDTKAASPARKPSPSPLGADEEVKIPSWLAPLSQSSEPAPAVSAGSTEAPLDHTVSLNSEESDDALVAEAPRRPETAVFGGQLLGESSAPTAEASSTGSKKGLFLGLAAAALLLVGGGWYYLQSHAGTSTQASARSTTAPSVTEPSSAAASNSPAAQIASAPTTTTVNSIPASSQPPKNSASASATATPIASPQSKNSNSTPKDVQPVEAPAKPSLGDVHLAAPVVNHAADSPQEGDAMPSIDTKTVPAGADPFASASSHNPPAAPLPVGGDVKPAELLKSIPPEYPAIAKSQHVSGSVQIDALIDASGNVASVKVLKGPTLLHRAALDAVKQWKYKPARLDGEPTSMHLTVTVEFRDK
jgi:periplasmic protein TonB